MIEDKLDVDNLSVKQKIALKDFLFSLLTENRKKRFAEVLANRTKYISVVLEDIFQAHNASAVLRSCDCFGVQDVHFVENYNDYNISDEVTMGADKWLNIKRYNQEGNQSEVAIKQLRDQGYRIVATTPHTNDVTIDELPLEEGKIALFFGTEHTGLSKHVMDNADCFVKIPMYGFTESFNISVSAALSLYSITERMRNSDVNWKLTDKEIMEIELDWARKSIRRLEIHEAYFMNHLLKEE